jgi:cytochrome c-type biogenesis protein CcmF
MEYIGEHLLPGQLGHFFVVLSFAASLVALYSYIKAANTNDNAWLMLAKRAFQIHTIGILGIITSLFFLIYNHYFEYHYVWQHSSLSLPAKYMISCFWEGQEGSFLLWTFWHVVLGNILIKRSKEWQAPVMAVVAMVQVFLTSMLLGVYIFDLKLGSSPFLLIRELPEYINLPFTQMADYLSLDQFADGRGLNPLLQNYWMTIHPPTLFLGFALTLIPFAYAIAGLWKREYISWTKPATSWIFFGVMVLGTGILMGGAWAYEALSFGGFWAWDPVENASLVPWLTLLAAAHVLLIMRNKRKASITAFILVIISFMLVLYSTFLTRSGILGDTSVHAFVDLGLNGQLLAFLLFFLVLSLTFLIYRAKDIPKSNSEEAFSSREFWMFIGALVLTISAIQITSTTSIPVFNTLFGMDKAPPLDPIAHYNSWQVPLAVIICILIAITQFFSYRKSDGKLFLKRITAAFITSLVIATGIIIFLDLQHPLFMVLSFASVFTIIANLDYWLRIAKGSLNVSGAAVAHIGFGFIILGSLISNGKQEIVSSNDTYIAEDFPSNENILLAKNDTVLMGNYMVVWHDEYQEGVNKYYKIQYFEKSNGEWVKAFELEPFVQLNEKFGNVAEPATQHFLSHDVYTHITYADLSAEDEEDDGYNEGVEIDFEKGDTVIYDQYFIILDSLTPDRELTQNSEEFTVLALKAHVSVKNMNGESFTAAPTYLIVNNETGYIDSEIDTLGLKFQFKKVNVASEKEIHPILEVKSKKEKDEFIIMKAIVFPYINLLWLGSILMIIGTILALIARYRREN